MGAPAACPMRTDMPRCINGRGRSSTFRLFSSAVHLFASRSRAASMIRTCSSFPSTRHYNNVSPGGYQLPSWTRGVGFSKVMMNVTASPLTGKLTTDPALRWGIVWPSRPHVLKGPGRSPVRSSLPPSGKPRRCRGSQVSPHTSCDRIRKIYSLCCHSNTGRLSSAP